MATDDDLRRIALSMPECYEDLHRRRPTFRVNKRIFAMLGVAGNRALFSALDDGGVTVLKLDRDDQLNMMALLPGAVVAAEHYGHHGWTYLRLRELDADALAILVRLAWAHVAPKRLARPG